eukprot:2043163-Amphidinium_carterae.1
MQLTAQQFKHLNRTYINLLKRTCNLPTMFPQQWTHIGEIEFLDAIAQPRLHNILLVQRLTFLQRLLYNPNELVRGMLMEQGARSFWSMWYVDLQEVHELIPQVQYLPAPCANTRHLWTAHIALAQQEWPEQLKRHLTPKPPSDHKHLKGNCIPASCFLIGRPDDTACGSDDEFQVPAPRVPPPAAQVPQANIDMDVAAGHILMLPFGCDQCDRRFREWRGLQLHRRRTHGIIAPLALRVRGTQCVVCKSFLGSRCHLLQHLSNSVFCALHTMTLPAMSYAECHRDIHVLQSTTTSLSRPQAPRTGPIPWVNGTPISQQAPPINPLVDTTASYTSRETIAIRM